MDIKDLNKSQLILLALLVSFVTSIATGITTVTLLQQAPESVTIPISRVVRETIEKVVPGDVITKTETVVIKEEDLQVGAIARASKSFWTVNLGAADNPKEAFFAANAIAIGDGSVLALDGRNIYSDKNYYGSHAGANYGLVFGVSNPYGLRLMKVELTSAEAKKVADDAIDIADVTKLKIGQKAIVLKQDGSGIMQGFFLGLAEIPTHSASTESISTETASSTASSTPVLVEQKIPVVRLSIVIPKEYAGSAVVNLDGELIGIVSLREGEVYIIPSSEIFALLAKKSAQ